MDVQQLVGTIGIYGATFVIAVISSVLPIVSIDVFLVGLTLAIGPAELVPIALVAAAGQTVGKLPVYFATRKLASLPGKHRARIDRVRERVARWRASPPVIVTASALFGLPPFSLLSTAAGLVAMPARRFCLIVGVCRAIRSAVIIAAAGHWS
ncbi:MAG TPA: VTT domain-containing protein [Kofleriaceae bacterium]|nr:VTT domain-containing protein [Kofleriaceae bacterium]